MRSRPRKSSSINPSRGWYSILDAEDKEKSELHVPLDELALAKAKQEVASTASRIRDRDFHRGPTERGDGRHRCSECDFISVCGMTEAITVKRGRSGDW